MRRIGIICFIVILCVFPTCTLAEIQESDAAVVMRMHGGFGVHFFVKNDTPYNVTVNYTIRTGRSVLEGVVYCSYGSSARRSVYPIAIFSEISVLLDPGDTGQGRLIKYGYIIGCFVMIM
ncbi:MAG: hypothetical protein V1726_02210 [Methanobacteriota archaeon]